VDSGARKAEVELRESNSWRKSKTTEAVASREAGADAPCEENEHQRK